MSIWAVCGPCSRSFSVASERLHDLTTVVCQDCGAKPAQFEARTDTGDFELSVVDADSDLSIEPVVWLR